MLYKFGVTILLSIIFITGCGRKQRNIFSFDSEPEIKVTKLDLPSVRGLCIKKTSDGHLLTWLDLFLNKHNQSFRNNFVGYDIYRLTKQNFVPKNPLNNAPITETHFLDKGIKLLSATKSSKTFYLIQPVFKFDNQIIKGPSSQIVGIEN